MSNNKIYRFVVGFGGGSSTTPKKNDGPNLIQRIGNLFSRLFGGAHNSAKISTVLPGAVVTRAWTLEIGELTRIGASSLEGLGTGAVSVGGVTLGALLVPTMIGEPEFNWTRDLPLDVPITTTGEPEPTITLYRGVSSKAKGSMYFEAMQGIAIPAGFRQVASLSWCECLARICMK